MNLKINVHFCMLVVVQNINLVLIAIGKMTLISYDSEHNFNIKKIY